MNRKMNMSNKYDPEDIESLLMHKQFNELYPEEREFVLRHVEGEDEYESLRQTLFLMHDAADQDEWLEPDPSIAKNLMAQFVREEKKGFYVWLNGLFAAPFVQDRPWYRKPAMQYALAGVVLIAVVGGAWYYTSQSSSGGDIASIDAAESKQETDTLQQSPSELTQAGNRTYADNLKPDVFPPAPQPIDEEMKYPQVEFIPTEESAESVVTEGTLNYSDANFDVSISAADDVADEAPAPAEPVLSSGERQINVDEDKLANTNRTLNKKTETTLKDNSNQEDLAKEKAPAVTSAKALEATNDAENEVSTVVFTDSSGPVLEYTSGVTTNSSSPVQLVSATALGSSETFKWSVIAAPANSRNTAELKSVVSVLFTAK